LKSEVSRPSTAIAANSCTFFDALQQQLHFFVAKRLAGGEDVFVLELHSLELVYPVLV
jgi:hypothetical protein